MALYRSDMGHISVSVAGVTIDNVSWDSMEGGDITVDSQNYNPGGMVPAVSLGGKRSRSTLTIERVYSDTLVGAYIALDNAAGIAAVTASFQTLAADHKTPVGNPITYTGTLGTVTRPKYDSTSSSPQMLQIVVDCNEAISG